MRKTIVALVAAVAFLSTGCTIQVGPESAPTPVESTQAVPESPLPDTLSPEDTDEIFLSTIRNEYPFLQDIPDSDLIGLAKDACAMFDAGATPQDIFDIIGSGGGQQVQEAMAYTIGSGVASYCPEYVDKFMDSPPTV